MKSFKRRCFPLFQCNMVATQLFFVDSMLCNFNLGLKAFQTKSKFSPSMRSRARNHRCTSSSPSVLLVLVLLSSLSVSSSPLPLPPPQIQQTLNDVFEFISLPPSDIEDVNPKNSRSYSEMSPQVTPPSLIRLLLL
jgi:hypothetical protein